MAESVIGLPVWDAAGLILADDWSAVAEALRTMDAAELTQVLGSALAMAHEAARAGQRMDVVARRVLAERRSGQVS